MPAIEVELPMGDAFSHYSGRIKTNSQNYKPPFLSSTCSPSRRAGRSHGWPPSLSPTAHRSEAIERAVCISPFRSVRQMKEPFQLKLPVSPSHEGHRSSMGLARQSSGNKGQPRTLSSPIEFKPKRPCVSSQDLSSSTLKTIGLLPSPSFSEPCKRPEPGYSGMSQCDEIKQSNPLNEEFGVALTSSPPRHAEQDRPQLESESVKAHDMERMASTAESQFPPHMNSFEVQSSSFPIEHKTRDRTGTTSSAASWAPSNLKKCESWLQGVPTETSELEDEKTREMNRRKIQIIQQEEEYREEWSSPPVLRTPNQSPKQGRKPVRHRIDTEAANQSIMFAIATKTKPKLVDISRPPSSTTLSVPIHPPPSWRPSTPSQQSVMEVSAFSPDTPYTPESPRSPESPHVPPSLQDIPDSGYVTQQSNHSSEDNPNDSQDDDYLDQVLDREWGSDKRASSDKPHSKKAKQSSCQNSARRTCACNLPTSPKTVDQETLTKWCDHEWTLDQLETAIRDFPTPPLRLTSPVIILLRQNQESALLRPFRSIFPSAPDDLLDCLCAALVARNYLTSAACSIMDHLHQHRLIDPYPCTASPSSNNLSRLDSVPEKARARLGITLPSPAPCRVTERLMKTRSQELRNDLDAIVDKLIYAICGRHDDTIKAAVIVLMETLESKA